MILVVFFFLHFLSGLTTTNAAAEPPIPQRVASLLKTMTLQQKVNQLLHPWVSNPRKTVEQYCAEYNSTGLGAIYLFWAGTSSDAAGILEDRNKLQKCVMEGSGVPVSFVQEALHSGGANATIYPMPAGLGSTWNTALIEELHSQIAFSARRHGADRTFSPVMNAATDPRYGRQQESWSEDPYHTARMSISAIRGLQGPGGPTTYLQNSSNQLIATAKSFVAYARTSGGIDGSPAYVSQSQLNDLYLYTWRAAAKEGLLRSVMAGQNMVNGVPMHANKRLLIDVLRKEFAIESPLTVSDGADCIGALMGFHVVSTREEAAILAVETGMDMDLGGITLATLVPAVKAGKVAEAVVDRAVSDVLTSKFASGLFETPYADPSKLSEGFNNPTTSATALQAAEEGMILLINDNHMLPLKDYKSVKSVAIIGSLSDDASSQCGGYTHFGAQVKTVKIAAETLFGKSKVTYSEGAQPGSGSTVNITKAVQVAKSSELVILIVGDDQTTCGEMYDRQSLDLPGAQLQLVDAITKANDNTIVGLMHGRVATFGYNNQLLTQIKAMIAMWRPGQEGGTAFFNIITGNSSPSGKTAQSWPRSVGQVQGPSNPYLYPFQGNHQNENYVFEHSSPLFPFGFGLTYTTWKHSVTVTPPSLPIASTKPFDITVKLSNTGNVEALQVVQIYFTDVISSSVRIGQNQLIRFTKVSVPAATDVEVRFQVHIDDLSYYSELQEKTIVEKGEFIFWASIDGSEFDKNTPKQHANVV